MTYLDKSQITRNNVFELVAQCYFLRKHGYRLIVELNKKNAEKYYMVDFAYDNGKVFEDGTVARVTMAGDENLDIDWDFRKDFTDMSALLDWMYDVECHEMYIDSF